MVTRSSAGTKVPQHPWPLADLPAPARATLLANASERRFQADEVLYLAGSPAHALYLVLEGRVRLLRGRSGRAIFIHDEEAGGALGEIPLFEGTTYPATAIASEPTRCLVLQREAILVAIHNNPDLALAILARLAARVRFLVDKLDRTANHSTLGRLAELILARAQAGHGESFTLGATQQQAAEEIGTVRELVVRGLRTLRDRDAIESRGGGRYVVMNEALLREIATAGE
jgi:CRP/FNR family transcriptional regulator, dissimilatory nitrate respiration regulator